MTSLLAVLLLVLAGGHACLAGSYLRLPLGTRTSTRAAVHGREVLMRTGSLPVGGSIRETG